MAAFVLTLLVAFGCGRTTRNDNVASGGVGGGTGNASSTMGGGLAGSGGQAAVTTTTGGVSSATTGQVAEDCQDATTPVAKKRIVRLTTDQLLSSVGRLVHPELEASLRENHGHAAYEREALPLLAPDEGTVYTTESWATSDAIADAAGVYVRDRLEVVTGCEANPSRACAEASLLELAARAFRNTLSDAERTNLLTLFDDVLSTEASVPEAVRYGTYAIFSAPQFLYRYELGDDVGASGLLAPHELASQLAYFLTDGPPDAVLSAAVEQGRFESQADWQREVDRLLESPEARLNLASALYAYFGFQRVGAVVIDPVLAPELDDALRESMLGEVRRVVERSMQEGRVDDLLTSRFSFVDQTLAEFYGIAFPPPDSALDDAGFGWAELPPGRSGLLTSAAFLLTTSRPDGHSVVKRGMLVRGAMACADPVSIPEFLTEHADPLEDATQRLRSEYRMATPPCGSCHSFIDPYGLALESFDVLGKLRSNDTDGSPIDDTATLPDGAAVDGPEELSAQLTLDDAFATCLARYWVTFALSEPPDNPLDDCSVHDIMQDFARTSRRLPDLVRAVAISEIFSHRRGGTAP